MRALLAARLTLHTALDSKAVSKAPLPYGSRMWHCAVPVDCPHSFLQPDPGVLVKC